MAAGSYQLEVSYYKFADITDLGAIDTKIRLTDDDIQAAITATQEHAKKLCLGQATKSRSRLVEAYIIDKNAMEVAKALSEQGYHRLYAPGMWVIATGSLQNRIHMILKARHESTYTTPTS